MRVVAALIAAAWIVCGAAAWAQSPLPDAVRSAGVTQAQWDAIQREARAQARRANISEAALLAAADAASSNLAASGRFDALGLQRTIFQSLAEQADQIAELQRRLDALTGDSDPTAAALFAQARAALDDGRLDQADGLLAQAAERDLAAMQQADAEAARRRLRAGDTIASRGQVAFVQANYLVAAEHYARAADIVPQSAIEPRWRYTMWRGSALHERGEVFNEPEPLAQSIAAYEAALVLRPRESAPENWATAQNHLGVVLLVQGERGVAGAFERSVEASQAALTVLTREADPEGWAETQNNLGNALNELAQRGERGALQRAVAAYEAALTVMTREADPASWAGTQNNLGNALTGMGERGAPGALDRAIAAFEAALTVRTQEADPSGWAQTQHNLGVALYRRGERGAPAATERALAALEAALTVRTRETDPAGWAQTQMALGVALTQMGERGSPGALERAVAAFEAALTVRTREADPAGWARTQMNLANALLPLGERGVAGAFDRAVAAYEAALTVRTRQADPTGWAQTQYNLALTYQAMRRYPEARAAAQGALEEFERTRSPYAARARAVIAELPAQ